MSKNTDLVKKLFVDCNIAEREEVRQWIKEYDESTLEKRSDMRDTFNKSLGPIAGLTCVLCGK